ncbi:unnamed protein product, partial [Amoebophrya sp. A120]|eukprot:GSA120T00018753001.1
MGSQINPDHLVKNTNTENITPQNLQSDHQSQQPGAAPEARATSSPRAVLGNAAPDAAQEDEEQDAVVAQQSPDAEQPPKNSTTEKSQCCVSEDQHEENKEEDSSINSGIDNVTTATTAERDPHLLAAEAGGEATQIEIAGTAPSSADPSLNTSPERSAISWSEPPAAAEILFANKAANEVAAGEREESRTLLTTDESASHKLFPNCVTTNDTAPKVSTFSPGSVNVEDANNAEALPSEDFVLTSGAAEVALAPAGSTAIGNGACHAPCPCPSEKTTGLETSASSGQERDEQVSCADEVPGQRTSSCEVATETSCSKAVQDVENLPSGTWTADTPLQPTWSSTEEPMASCSTSGEQEAEAAAD